ncbi:MAG: hypothetical protein WC919_06850 [Candidatus Paceibacterota bacterium]|jgi:hypothetical protein
MSIETITIIRQAPVINGFVILANNLPSKITYAPVSEFVGVTGGVVNRLSMASGMGRNGHRFGKQEWVELTATELEIGKTAYQTNVRSDQKYPWQP